MNSQNEKIERSLLLAALRKELLKKMNGEPDFLAEEKYASRPGARTEEEAAHVYLVAAARLPTRYGQFIMYGFFDAGDGKDHTALVRGDIRDKDYCPIRVHSECHTGDIWGSLRCDCRDQLEAGIRFIAERPFGAIVYLRQEGRGIGLLNKLKAYHLQELGLDTIEANQFLGYPADARTYTAAAKILKLLGVRSVSLLTNNPDKVDQLTQEGVVISERVPIIIDSNPWNSTYLQTKRDRMGHIM